VSVFAFAFRLFTFAFHERGRQPVEKFRVGGAFAEEAVVVGRANQSGPEVVLPDTIDDDAGGKRMIRAGQPLREFEASALFVVDRGGAIVAENGQEAARDFSILFCSSTAGVMATFGAAFSTDFSESSAFLSSACAVSG
jgi:hypothetical protein